MDAAGARALIDQMRQELQLIVDQVVAQGQHIPNFQQFAAQQEAVINAFENVSDHMLQHAETVHGTWTDVAGDTYTWALRESSNSVGEFAAHMQSANVQAGLAEVNSQISMGINEVLGIQARFDAKAAEVLALIALYESLAGMANPTAAQVAEAARLAARITAGLTELRRLVDTAVALREGLNNWMARIASQISAAAGGTPQWYGPQGTGAPAPGPAVAAPGPAAVSSGPPASNTAPLGDTGAADNSAATAGAGGAGATAAGAGGAGAGGGAAGAGGAGGAPAAGGAGAAGGGAAIPPIAPISAAGVGGSSSKGVVPGTGINPLPRQVPEIAAGLGSDGATRFPGVAGVPFAPFAAGAAVGGGKQAGIPPALGIPPIAKAAPTSAPDIPGLARVGIGADDGIGAAGFDPAAGVGGPGGAGDAGGQERGGTPMMPPPPMAPMAGAGAGGGGSPGDGKGPGSPERRRPARNVPGVPKRLRGRAGTLDSTPAFMATPASAARPREAEPTTVEVLDERLWQVEETPVDKRFATG